MCKNNNIITINNASFSKVSKYGIKHNKLFFLKLRTFYKNGLICDFLINKKFFFIRSKNNFPISQSLQKNSFSKKLKNTSFSYKDLALTPTEITTFYLMSTSKGIQTNFLNLQKFEGGIFFLAVTF